MAASESVPEPHTGFTENITRTRLPASCTTVLSGESFSLFGTQISSVMIPLIVAITLSAGEITLGVVSAVGWLPIILIGLIAGAIVDRHSRWTRMVVCNITRAGLIGLIPLLALTQNLTVTVLVVISFCMGVCNVFFDIAYQTYVPDIVPRNMLDRANNRIFSSTLPPRVPNYFGCSNFSHRIYRVATVTRSFQGSIGNFTEKFAEYTQYYL